MIDPILTTVTLCGPGTPYGIVDLGYDCFRQRCVVVSLALSHYLKQCSLITDTTNPTGEKSIWLNSQFIHFQFGNSLPYGTYKFSQIILGGEGDQYAKIRADGSHFDNRVREKTWESADNSASVTNNPSKCAVIWRSWCFYRYKGWYRW